MQCCLEIVNQSSCTSFAVHCHYTLAAAPPQTRPSPEHHRCTTPELNLDLLLVGSLLLEHRQFLQASIPTCGAPVLGNSILHTEITASHLTVAITIILLGLQ